MNWEYQFLKMTMRNLRQNVRDMRMGKTDLE
jgi:hypothetical protein